MSKRYSQFEALHAALISQFPIKLSDAYFPPKQYKLFVSHYSPEFVEERRVLLNNYFKKCTSLPDVARCSELLEFFAADRVDEPVEQPVEDEAEELPDDLEVTDISIPTTRTMSDHVLYQCDVINAKLRSSFQKWTALKRYGQFYDMDVAVRADFASQPEVLARLPPFPPRKAKLLQDHMDQAFVEGRRALLENYMKKMIRIVPVARNKTFLEFIGVH